MAEDYTREDEDHSYRADIDLYGIDGSTMTDCGLPAAELEPIGDASLSPGEGSPLGRAPCGDLAYPVFPDRETLTLPRRDLALIVAALPPCSLRSLIARETLPKVLYPETAHGRMAFEGDMAALLEGRLDDISLLKGQ